MAGTTPVLLAASSEGSGAAFPILLVVLAVAFYLLVLRPQRSRARRMQTDVAGMTVGDDVITRGGLLGTVVGLTDDEAVLALGPGVEVRVLRATLARRPRPTDPADSADPTDPIDPLDGDQNGPMTP